VNSSQYQTPKKVQIIGNPLQITPASY